MTRLSNKYAPLSPPSHPLVINTPIPTPAPQEVPTSDAFNLLFYNKWADINLEAEQGGCVTLLKQRIYLQAQIYIHVTLYVRPYYVRRYFRYKIKFAALLSHASRSKSF